MNRTCSVAGCVRDYYGLGLCNMHWQRRRNGLEVSLPPKTPKGQVREWIIAHANWKGRDCLPWPFATRLNGYPKAVFNPLHLMCEIAHGPMPSPTHEIAHSCGKGHLGCINPQHLRWATRSENMWDKEAHGTLLRGSKIRNSRLTEKDIGVIRRSALSHGALAKTYGVSRSTISHAISHKTWKHVP